MPILSQKDNPPSRCSNHSILESEGTWWIAKLKPRQEKAFACDLLKREIEYYLPLYTKAMKRNDGKNRKTTLVLFPSYVPFVIDDPYPLLQLNRIATILPVQAQSRFKQQLHQVYVANESNIPLVPIVMTEFQNGEQVQVTSGPLKGVVGTVVRTQGHSTLVLKVDGLGAACISINSANVQQTFPNNCNR
jgi:hypothetical protein